MVGGAPACLGLHLERIAAIDDRRRDSLATGRGSAGKNGIIVVSSCGGRRTDHN